MCHRNRRLLYIFFLSRSHCVSSFPCQIVDDGSANMLHGGHGDYWRKSKEVSMGDAYRTLVKAISQNDVPLRLEITAERDLVSDGCCHAERVRCGCGGCITRAGNRGVRVSDF